MRTIQSRVTLLAVLFPAAHLPNFFFFIKVEPFNNNPEFTPEQIEKASKACTAICMWALAMYQYHFVALGVAPKVRAPEFAPKLMIACKRLIYLCCRVFRRIVRAFTQRGQWWGLWPRILSFRLTDVGILFVGGVARVSVLGDKPQCVPSMRIVWPAVNHEPRFACERIA